MGKIMKKQSINLSRHFSNLIKLGLDQELPRGQIVKGKNHLLPILREHSKRLLLNEVIDLEKLAEELSELAIHIQAFAFNCLKLAPLTDAPINIADKDKFRFKKAKLLSRSDYVDDKKYSRKALDFVHKLYYLNEFGYEKGNDLLRSISVKLEPKGLINNKKEEILIAGNESFKLPPSLHEEFIRDLTALVEKFTGRIDMYKDLHARKDFGSQIIIAILKESCEPYFRKSIYKAGKTNIKFPSDPEALLLAFVLVTAGILPTETEYNMQPIRNGRRKVYAKTTHPELGKIDKKTKVDKDYERPYITRIRERITSEPERRGVFYTDKTTHKFLNELV